MRLLLLLLILLSALPGGTVAAFSPAGTLRTAASTRTTTYTARGQTDVVTLPDGRTSDSDYFLTGEVSQVTGTAAPAVAYNRPHQ